MNGEDLSEANKESKYLKAFHTLNESKKKFEKSQNKQKWF